MLVEIIGPSGVGKTTVGPLVAERLGVEHHFGSGLRTPDGRRRTPVQVTLAGVPAVVRHPLLFLGALRLRRDVARRRVNFAFSVCRRHRLSRQVAQRGAVVSGGMLHGICQEAEVYGGDYTDLAPRVVAADLYVVLHAEPAVIGRRYADREGRKPPPVDRARVGRYFDAVTVALEKVGRPAVWVEASAAPDDVADAIASRLRSTDAAPS